MASPAEMIERLREICVTKEEVEGMGAKELEGKIVTGVFVDA